MSDTRRLLRNATDRVQVTWYPFWFPERGAGVRDSKNVDRLWREWKALHLVRNPRTLTRILGRHVNGG